MKNIIDLPQKIILKILEEVVADSKNPADFITRLTTFHTVFLLYDLDLSTLLSCLNPKINVGLFESLTKQTHWLDSPLKKQLLEFFYKNAKSQKLIIENTTLENYCWHYTNKDFLAILLGKEEDRLVSAVGQYFISNFKNKIEWEEYREICCEDYDPRPSKIIFFFRN